MPPQQSQSFPVFEHEHVAQIAHALRTHPVVGKEEEDRSIFAELI